MIPRYLRQLRPPPAIAFIGGLLAAALTAQKLFGGSAVLVVVLVAVLAGTTLLISAITRGQDAREEFLELMAASGPPSERDALAAYNVHHSVASDELTPYVRRRRATEQCKADDKGVVVLLGGPQTGKSRLLYELIADAGYHCFVPRRRVDGTSGATKALAYREKLPKAVTPAGHAMLLTGVDEAFRSRDVTATDLAAWAKAHPGCRLFVELSNAAARSLEDEELSALQTCATVVQLPHELDVDDVEAAAGDYAFLTATQRRRLPQRLTLSPVLHRRFTLAASGEHDVAYHLLRWAAQWRLVGLTGPVPSTFLRSVLRGVCAIWRCDNGGDGRTSGRCARV